MFEDKQKQIEEMAKDICVECDFPTCIPSKACDSWGYAENAINAGYRKIPENAVVLTREEYQMLNYFNHRGEELLKQERKETAEKYAEMLTDGRQTLDIFEKDTGKVCDKAYIIPQSFIDEIAKEITEGKECQNK